jgi:hypothetical protein
VHDGEPRTETDREIGQCACGRGRRDHLQGGHQDSVVSEPLRHAGEKDCGEQTLDEDDEEPGVRQRTFVNDDCVYGGEAGGWNTPEQAHDDVRGAAVG